MSIVQGEVPGPTTPFQHLTSSRDAPIRLDCHCSCGAAGGSGSEWCNSWANEVVLQSQPDEVLTPREITASLK